MDALPKHYLKNLLDGASAIIGNGWVRRTTHNSEKNAYCAIGALSLAASGNHNASFSVFLDANPSLKEALAKALKLEKDAFPSTVSSAIILFNDTKAHDRRDVQRMFARAKKELV